MEFKVALVGNPNSGKTTLFNALTGAYQYVGNWPGVTVEKKEGRYKEDKNIVLTDLPGIYSLSPYTLEEVVSRNYLLQEKVDAIINIVDGSNLERNLFLTTQLLELGIPVVLAINMMDIVQKRQDVIDFEGLKNILGCAVIPISAQKKDGLESLMDTVRFCFGKQGKVLNLYEGDIEKTLKTIETQLPDSVAENKKWFYSIKVFERDSKIGMSLCEEEIGKLEDRMEDDSESLVTDARYNFISKVIKRCYKKKRLKQLSVSDRIDKIVTNRILAIPIFVGVMFVVYYLSITTIGQAMTDWTNDVFFGEIISPFISDTLVSLHCATWLQSLIVDGIVAGVGAVLGFVPQMVVLFVLLAILEDCGYMARIAFIMDRIFRKFGLSGKSFIPMLIGTGCGVPAVMASRTIENERDRKMTIMTTTFIPCSAKLPIIALIAGALFGGASWVAPSAYFVGMLAIVISGILLKKTKLFEGDPAPFVMEMPSYHMPRLSNILRSTWERASSFIRKAGTVILLSTILIWFLMDFGFQDGSFGMVDNMDHSLLATIGHSLSWVFAPLGWDNWKAAVSCVTGLIAKENVVGTFGQLYGFASVQESGNEVWGLLAQDFTTLSAYSFLVFNLLCAPCFAAIGAIKREMNDKKWTWLAIGYECGFAYVVSMLIYQIGTFVTTRMITVSTIIAFACLIVLIYLVVRPARQEG